MLGTLLILTALAYGSYRLGYFRAEREGNRLLDMVQYPPGCTCIRNALGASSSCPHHGNANI